MARPRNRTDAGEAAPKQGPTLEEFFVACQKSLARSAINSSETGKSESEFALGERPIYVIEGLELDVNVGIRLSSDESAWTPDAVHLDFDAPPEFRSRLKFRVLTKPQELLGGAKLQLANLDPLGEAMPVVRLRVWLVDQTSAPVPNYPVMVHFARAGDKRLRETEQIELNTDVVGRVDFFIETDKAEKNLKVIGVRRRYTVHIRGSARGVGSDEFYIWATCDRSPDWEKVVEPVAPRPPLVLGPTGEERRLVSSELMKLKL